MVDLSLVLDVSSSIGWQWPTVRDAARTFVDAFDKNNDRVSLLTFGNGAVGARRRCRRPRLRQGQGDRRRAEQPAGRQHEHGRRAVSRLGRAALGAGRPAVRPARHRALHRRRVEQRAGQLRRGARPRPGAPHLRLPEELARSGRPDLGQPADRRPLRHRRRGTASPSVGVTVVQLEQHLRGDRQLHAVRAVSAAHQLPRLSPQLGHPDLVPAADRLAEGQRHRRSRARAACGTSTPAPAAIPAEVFNINNAARNLVEIIANAARNDTGDYTIRIYTIGMGELVRYKTRHAQEMSEDILKRIANDTHVARLQQQRSSKASTTSRRPRPTSGRRSRRSRTRSSG